MVDELKWAELGGYMQWEAPSWQCDSPPEGRLHRQVFYEQLQRVIYVLFDGRGRGCNLKIEVSFL